MPRSYRRRVAYRGARDKYSVEQTPVALSSVESGTTSSVDVVPSTDLQGMRKVKHLTVTASVSFGMYWALMYIPAGMSVPSISLTDSLVEPNQFVMNCGVFDPDAGPCRISSRISRNLNSGDRVVLLMRPIAAGGSFHGLVRYAVTLQ